MLFYFLILNSTEGSLFKEVFIMFYGLSNISLIELTDFTAKCVLFCNISYFGLGDYYNFDKEHCFYISSSC